MAKDPAFLFYSNDFLTGTMFFTHEQKGKYITMLCVQHQSGHLSEKIVLDICGKFDEEIMNKFEKDEQGLYFNKRLDEEKVKRNKFTESRRKNLKSCKNNITTSHMVSHMENENENRNIDINSIKEYIKKTPIIYDDDFLTFWKIYDMDIQQQECFNQWQYIDAMNKTLILKRIQNYVDNTEKNFRKEPLKYLRNRIWLDEVVARKDQKQTQRRNNIQEFVNKNTF